jgi:hypothetical protein
VPPIGPVFVLIGENTDYQHLDATSSPYTMNNLRPRSAWFTNYYAATHWSQANYIALTSGRFTDCEQADFGYACRDDVDNVFHQLEVARRSWHVWLEAGTAKCDTGSGGSCTSNDPCPLTGFYTTGNPPINYTDISYADCLANDVPAGDETDGMSAFNAALARGDVSDFNMVIPNGCEDGEANCKPVNNRYTQFDDFLAREVPLIQASPAYDRNAVIVVLFDEAQRQGGINPKDPLTAGGHTICFLIGPGVQPGSYGRTTYAYSVLRMLQDGYGVGPYLGHAAEVRTIDQIWR